jgi:hypothetical protein
VTTKKLYIAGPMSGLPDYNYPAFHAAEAELQSAGYETLNPANNPKPEPETWEGYMRLALAQVIAADGIAYLPNSGKSRGALLELHVAAELDMPAKPIAEWLGDD